MASLTTRCGPSETSRKTFFKSNYLTYHYMMMAEKCCRKMNAMCSSHWMVIIDTDSQMQPDDIIQIQHNHH